MGDHPHGAAPRRSRPGSSVLTPPTGLPTVPEEWVAPRAAVPGPPPPGRPAEAAVVDPCRCGHGRDAHEHHRPGSDCGACGSAVCARFTAAGGRARRLLRRFGR
jgi:hypothetical protein